MKSKVDNLPLPQLSPLRQKLAAETTFRLGLGGGKKDFYAKKDPGTN